MYYNIKNIYLSSGDFKILIILFTYIIFNFFKNITLFFILYLKKWYTFNYNMVLSHTFLTHSFYLIHFLTGS